MPEGAHFIVMGLHGVGWALVHTLWLGGAIWVVVKFALAVLPRRASVGRYALCYAGLTALAVTPVVLSMIILVEYQAHTAWVKATAMDLAVRSDAPPSPDGMAHSILVSPTMRAAIVRNHDAMYRPRLTGTATRWLGWGLAFTAFLWVSVLTVHLLRVGWGVMVLTRLAALGACPPAPCWQLALATVQRRMGIRRRITLLASRSVGVPVVFGSRRLVILVPAGNQERFSFVEARAILAHELAHVRRWDSPMAVAQAVAEAAACYHPVGPWLSRRIQEEREICADDVAWRANDIPRHVYARALLKLETLRPPLGAPVLAAVGSGGLLVTRVHRLTDGDGHRPRIGPRVVATVLAAALVALAVTAAAGPLVSGSEHIVMQHDLQALEEVTLPRP